MRKIFLFLFAVTSAFVYAQNTLPTPGNILETYEKGTRSVTGAPGVNYWQNSADYTIHVNFFPGTRLLTGSEEIVYTNNSPDVLRLINFKLFPDFYKKGSPRGRMISPADVSEGMVIDQMSIDGKPVDVSKLFANGTNLPVRIPGLEKGKKIRFDISYHYTLNKGSHNRTGEIEPGADFIAYFFPRIAVYDDIAGWDMNQYTGTQEFYNDFCHFNTFITVPQNFVIWATGDLENCNEVLAPEFCKRLQQAEGNDGVTTIIDSFDLKKGGITATDKPENTWHFEADDVTDFAFAVSDHYIWKSTSLVVDPGTGRRTRVDAVFNPKHKDYFRVVNDARKTIEAMSYVFPAWPYPYSHETVVDGLDQMEYPMMVNDNPLEDVAESIELTDHEIFHTMFPFYMGINETERAWMDEGWATIGEWLISPMIDSSIVDLYGVSAVSASAGDEYDLPIVTPSTELNRGYFTNSYPKPAMGYLYIKDLLGDALFTKALHRYIENWHGKHPMPNDFFYSMNEGAGRNLNWFWEKWFFETGYPDLAISSVLKKGKGYSVKVISIGNKPVPVDLTVYYSDGTIEKIHRNIGVWEKGNTALTIEIKAGKKVDRIHLGGAHVPDADPRNNDWSAPGK